MTIPQHRKNRQSLPTMLQVTTLTQMEASMQPASNLDPKPLEEFRTTLAMLEAVGVRPPVEQ